MKYKGSCHCGQIAYEVEGQIGAVTECNCSICSRKGSLLWFVPREQLKMLTPEERMSTYTFNKHFIKHHFCPTCGIHPLAKAVDPSGKPMAAINVRCLEGVDPKSLQLKPFNGLAM